MVDASTPGRVRSGEGVGELHGSGHIGIAADDARRRWFEDAMLCSADDDPWRSICGCRVDDSIATGSRKT